MKKRKPLVLETHTQEYARTGDYKRPDDLHTAAPESRLFTNYRPHP